VTASPPPQPHLVLDSFAVLAYYRDEAGGPVVARMLNNARRGEVRLSIAVVNLAEVFYRTARERGRTRANILLSEFAEYPVDVVDIDRDLALEAALIKAEHPISYADCIAAALTERLHGTLVTGDPDFQRLQYRIPIEWLPRAQ
jgi:predicted nucleic acid-binding protein